MDYEKAYKEALERAKGIHSFSSDIAEIKRMEQIFPELADSEDERIRKALIDGFTVMKESKNCGKTFSNHNIPVVDILAWLEKQSEPKPVVQVSGELYEHIRNTCACIDDALSSETLADINDYLSMAERSAQSAFDMIEKQGKQKDINPTLIEKEKMDNAFTKMMLKGKIAPEAIKEEKVDNADKIEPVFHKGDWAVSNLDGKARQISEVHFDEYNSYYVVDEKSVNLEEYDRLHHLWTIQDAKEGDVLVASDDSIFIFKDVVNNICKHYIALTEDKTIQVNNNFKHYWESAKYARPSTKEQRALLFEKIREAGYTWDTDKKELKKIEDKPKWTDEDETVLNNLIYALANDRIGNDRDEYVSWLKSLKQRLQ